MSFLKDHAMVLSQSFLPLDSFGLLSAVHFWYHRLTQRLLVLNRDGRRRIVSVLILVLLIVVVKDRQTDHCIEFGLAP